MPEVTCPHYPPANANGPQYVCQGCGSLIANPRHSQNQANAIGTPLMLARPESRNQTRPATRRG